MKRYRTSDPPRRKQKFHKEFLLASKKKKNENFECTPLGFI